MGRLLWAIQAWYGEMDNLGHEVARGTIANILKAHGLEPAPEDYDVLTARSAEVAISIAEKKGGKSSGPRTFSPMAMKRLSSNDDVTIASPDSHSQNLCFEARRQVRI
ncbi:MAG: hypothetical protein DMG57_27820 [Acidobacteria bacterium]|nr:MAG: hypothetical protein DMG57_27820 [Acidobacteriota bacterium]